jgi:hypothetical protein
MGLFSGLFFLMGFWFWVFRGWGCCGDVGGNRVCGGVGFGLVYVFPGFIMV